MFLGIGYAAWAAYAAIAAAAVAAAGTYSASKSAANTADFNADAAAQDAKLQKQRAQEASEDFLKRQRLSLGRTRANRSAAGIDLLSGSAFDADSSLAEEISLQNERILRGGEVAATRADQEAQLSRARKTGATNAGYLNAGSTLLSGASQYYNA